VGTDSSRCDKSASQIVNGCRAGAAALALACLKATSPCLFPPT